MDDHEGTCDILLKPAKRKKSSNFDLCIICQGSDDEPVRKAQVSSIQDFLSAIGNCRNVRGLGNSMVVFPLFEKLRYSNERSTKFKSLYQE